MSKEDLHRCVIIGGAGGVGGMFASLLSKSGLEIFVIDIIPPVAKVQFEQCDITIPTTQSITTIRTQTW